MSVTSAVSIAEIERDLGLSKGIIHAMQCLLKVI